MYTYLLVEINDRLFVESVPLRNIIQSNTRKYLITQTAFRLKLDKNKYCIVRLKHSDCVNSPNYCKENTAFLDLTGKLIKRNLLKKIEKERKEKKNALL